jgi:hypothetical protein
MRQIDNMTNNAHGIYRAYKVQRHLYVLFLLHLRVMPSFIGYCCYVKYLFTIIPC